MKVCEHKKCSQQCSKQTQWGVGKCKGASYCSCSYYCNQPPVSPFTSPPTAEHITAPPRKLLSH
ncbi:unnamed protein product [Linum tenue]|uniref:Uncharacterized protein n=1 Tax=Linum tenue TaxID=586396 RepID=A0AAV0JCC3_9ROSI|nr:unnamed protein product [Linum tenue]